MTLEMNETVMKAFHKLITEGFLCAPILDENQKFNGFVDLLDISKFIISCIRQPSETEELNLDMQRICDTAIKNITRKI